MTLTIKSVEIDEYKRVTKIEFGEGSTSDEVINFLNGNGIARVFKSYDLPLEKPTTLWADARKAAGLTTLIDLEER